jgi:hypothetical protein
MYPNEARSSGAASEEVSVLLLSPRTSRTNSNPTKTVQEQILLIEGVTSFDE